MVKQSNKAHGQRILIIGAGYVGLVNAVCWAKLGFEVDLVEINPVKLELLSQAVAPFFEPELDLLLAEFANKKLFFHSNLKEPLARCPEFVFVCVGTPGKSNGQPDLTALNQVVLELCSELQSDLILICKSTVPVGNSAKLQSFIDEQLLMQNRSFSIKLVFSPEFLSQGQAINNFTKPDRLVFGLQDLSLKERLLQLHQSFVLARVPFFWVDFVSAEMAKYAANAMLATRISFINQIAVLTEKLGGNIDAVAQIIGADPRIGKHFLSAGIGFGGSCLPKDLAAINFLAKQFGLPFSIGEAVMQANFEQRESFLQQILSSLPNLNCSIIGIYGLAFKAQTDDLRESAGVWLAERLLNHGATVLIYDPLVKALPESLKKATLVNLPEGLLAVDALVITHFSQQIRQLLLKDFARLSAKKIFDARNNFVVDFFDNSDVLYYSVGRQQLPKTRNSSDLQKNC